MLYLYTLVMNKLKKAILVAITLKRIFLKCKTCTLKTKKHHVKKLFK